MNTKCPNNLHTTILQTLTMIWFFNGRLPNFGHYLTKRNCHCLTRGLNWPVYFALCQTNNFFDEATQPEMYPHHQIQNHCFGWRFWLWCNKCPRDIWKWLKLVAEISIAVKPHVAHAMVFHTMNFSLWHYCKTFEIGSRLLLYWYIFQLGSVFRWNGFQSFDQKERQLLLSAFSRSSWRSGQSRWTYWNYFFHIKNLGNLIISRILAFGCISCCSG